MRPLTLDPGAAPPPDMSREPEGFTVEVGSERIHFLDWGEPSAATGAEPAAAVLLIHGIGQTGWTWVPVARRLAVSALWGPDADRRTAHRAAGRDPSAPRGDSL